MKCKINKIYHSNCCLIAKFGDGVYPEVQFWFSVSTEIALLNLMLKIFRWDRSLFEVLLASLFPLILFFLFIRVDVFFNWKHFLKATLCPSILQIGQNSLFSRSLPLCSLEQHLWQSPFLPTLLLHIATAWSHAQHILQCLTSILIFAMQNIWPIFILPCLSILSASSLARLTVTAWVLFTFGLSFLTLCLFSFIDSKILCMLLFISSLVASASKPLWYSNSFFTFCFLLATFFNLTFFSDFSFFGVDEYFLLWPSQNKFDHLSKEFWVYHHRIMQCNLLVHRGCFFTGPLNYSSELQFTNNLVSLWSVRLPPCPCLYLEGSDISLWSLVEHHFSYPGRRDQLIRPSQCYH